MASQPARVSPSIAAALEAAQALIAHAEQRAASCRWRPHEAVGEQQFAALAAALRRQGRRRKPHLRRT